MNNSDMMDETAEWAVKQNQEEAKKVYQQVPLGPYKPAHSPYYFNALSLWHKVVKDLLNA